METTLSLSLKDIYKEPGVKDLQPLSCRAAFARALKAEREGDHVLAEQFLNDAIRVEQRPLA
jgi:hypothetical protein